MYANEIQEDKILLKAFAADKLGGSIDNIHIEPIHPIV